MMKWYSKLGMVLPTALMTSLLAAIMLTACGQISATGTEIEATQSATPLPFQMGTSRSETPMQPDAAPSSASDISPPPTPRPRPVIATIEQFAALPNYGVTTRRFDQVTNTEAKWRFLRAYHARQPGRWALVSYTLEGGPIFHHVVYEGQGTALRVLVDATKDGFAGSPKRNEYTCTALMERQGQLGATACTTVLRPGNVTCYPLD